jgi:hypothetical protein
MVTSSQGDKAPFHAIPRGAGGYGCLYILLEGGSNGDMMKFEHVIHGFFGSDTFLGILSFRLTFCFAMSTLDM